MQAKSSQHSQSSRIAKTAVMSRRNKNLQIQSTPKGINTISNQFLSPQGGQSMAFSPTINSRTSRQNLTARREPMFYGPAKTNLQPPHLFSKNTIELAIDRFGPKALPLNVQMGLAQSAQITIDHDLYEDQLYQSSQNPGPIRHQDIGNIFETDSIHAKSRSNVNPGNLNSINQSMRANRDEKNVKLYAYMARCKQESGGPFLKDDNESHEFSEISQSNHKRSTLPDQFVQPPKNQRPIVMGQHLLKRVHGLLNNSPIKKGKSSYTKDKDDSQSKSSNYSCSSKSCNSKNSVEALERRLFLEHDTEIMRISRKSQEKRTSLGSRANLAKMNKQKPIRKESIQNMGTMNKHTQQKLLQRHLELEKSKNQLFQKNFRQKFDNERSHCEKVIKQIDIDQNEMFQEPDIHKYIKNYQQYKNDMQEKLVMGDAHYRNHHNDDDDEQFDLNSQNSSICVEELDQDNRFVQEQQKIQEQIQMAQKSEKKNIGVRRKMVGEGQAHSIIKMYRYPDLLKKFEEDKDLTAQEKQENKMHQQYVRHLTKFENQRALFEVNLEQPQTQQQPVSARGDKNIQRSAKNKSPMRNRFITGQNGSHILSQIVEVPTDQLNSKEISNHDCSHLEIGANQQDKDSEHIMFRKQLSSRKESNIEKSSHLKNIKVFDDLESKQEFFQMSKENRKIYENEADAKFLQNCINMKVTPLPAFCRSKNAQIKKNMMPLILNENKNKPVQNKEGEGASLSVPVVDKKPQQGGPRIGEERTTLKLLQYYMSESIAKAMGQQLKDVKDNIFSTQDSRDPKPSENDATAKSPKTKVLMLQDNGLTDKGLSYILDGLLEQKTLESINITNNEIGIHSQKVFEQIFERQNWKKHVQEIRLSKIKFSQQKILIKFFKSLNEGYFGILALKLNEITLNDAQVFVQLNTYLEKSTNIIDLNLACCGFSSMQLEKISEIIKISETKSLKWLNLSENPIFYDTQKVKDANQKFIDNMASLIIESTLQHLSLSGMNLIPQYLIDICVSISKSKTLLGVHLSNNQFSQENDLLKRQLSTILGINYDQSLVLNELKKAETTKAMGITQSSVDSEEWVFLNAESKEVQVANNLSFQEEVVKPKVVNSFLGTQEQGSMANGTFVVQRTKGQPELQFQSILKARGDCEGLVQTDKWQIVEPGDVKTGSSSQLSRNCCYLCEKSPYTLLFYQRSDREKHFTNISNPKECKKIRDALFASKAQTNNFQGADSDVMISGSLVGWDVIKTKFIETYGAEIDVSFYEERKEESRTAKKRRDALRLGIQNEPNEQAKVGKWKIPPCETTKQLREQQKEEMKASERVKYGEILDDYGKNTTWQDQLKSNLKIQDDMCFINTPDFKIKKKLSESVRLTDQIYVYADYGLKPGKYSLVVFDCLDNTVWYKTVIIGLRQTQIIEPNITQVDFSEKPRNELCKLKFPKRENFIDFDIHFKFMPQKLVTTVSDVIKMKVGLINELGEEIKILPVEEVAPAKTNDETEDQKKEREEAELRILEEKMCRKNEHKLKTQSFESMTQLLKEKYGLFMFIFTKFCRTSTYPNISKQDFTQILKLLKFERKHDEINQQFPIKQIVTESGDIIEEQVQYFESEKQIFMALANMFQFDELDQIIKERVMPRVGEYIWDHFYDSIWENDNRQVMNIVFMNMKVIKEVHDEMKERDFKFYLKNFHSLIERKCPGEDWENYRDIAPEEYYSFYYKSKLQINETICPGLINNDYIKIYQKQAKKAQRTHDKSVGSPLTWSEMPDLMADLSFIEFAQFCLIMSNVLMTNYEIQTCGKRKFRIGERLKCPIDKVHRFLTYFIQKNQKLNVPVIEGYNNELSYDIEKESRHTLTRKQTSRMLLITDFKEKTEQKLATIKDTAKTSRSRFNDANDSSPTRGLNSSPRQRKQLSRVGTLESIIMQQNSQRSNNNSPSKLAEETDIYGDIKLKFVTWKQMCLLLNKNMVYEAENYYQYSDQSGESEGGEEL